MNKIFSNNSGITLVALVITIIVMIILASIGVHEGREMIIKSKMQTLKTNMLTMQAKAKAYAEEIEAKTWKLSGNAKTEKIANEFSSRGMQGPTTVDGKLEYTFKENGLSLMGLNGLETVQYKVRYSQDYSQVDDIIYVPGFSYNGQKYTKLSEIQTALLDK